MNKTILHWSYHNLKSIPTDLLDYAELEEVYLKENFIATIPEWLLKLIKLKFLHLLGNLIREIPENIYYLENLEFLDLSNNKLTSLPESVGKLVNLRRFSVGGNEIRILPKEIGNLGSLEMLDLSGNLLQSIPPQVARLTKLEEIILNDNMYLEILPSTLFLLPKLDSICADRCGLLYLPAVLSSSVTHVRLFNNRLITHIPIVYLEHIQRFYNLVYYGESQRNPSKYCLIREQETFRTLVLPNDIRRIYSKNNRNPGSLFEICMRNVGNNFKVPLDRNGSLPRNLLNAINNGPLATCVLSNCSRYLYSEYYLLLAKRRKSSSKLIFSCPFCSPKCMNKWKELNEMEYYSVDWSSIEF